MQRHLQGKASKRKFTLFAVACCRRVWQLILDERSRRVVEVLERWADQLGDDTELADAAVAARLVWTTTFPNPSACDLQPDVKDLAWARHFAALAAGYSSGVADPVLTAGGPHINYNRAIFMVRCAASVAHYAVEALIAATRFGNPDIPRRVVWEKVQDAENLAQCRLVDDIINNPSRSVDLDLSWLTWNSGTVPNLAQVIYDERTFQRLPILADALEEAGCTNAAVLGHCRKPGEHTRDCWVIDLLLDKQ